MLSLVLMMELPGEKAETVCTKAAEIFISLLPEIQAHANSDAPINDMTRAETTWKKQIKHEAGEAACSLVGQLCSTGRSSRKSQLGSSPSGCCQLVASARTRAASDAAISNTTSAALDIKMESAELRPTWRADHV